MNVCIGVNSAINLTTGQCNIMIGYGAGQNITTENNNIFIGVNLEHVNIHDSIIIGSAAQKNITIGGMDLMAENDTLKKRISELEEKVNELSNLIETLWYAPPNSGGPGFMGAQLSYNNALNIQKQKIIYNDKE